MPHAPASTRNCNIIYNDNDVEDDGVCDDDDDDDDNDDDDDDDEDADVYDDKNDNNNSNINNNNSNNRATCISLVSLKTNPRGASRKKVGECKIRKQYSSSRQTDGRDSEL